MTAEQCYLGLYLHDSWIINLSHDAYLNARSSSFSHFLQFIFLMLILASNVSKLVILWYYPRNLMLNPSSYHDLSYKTEFSSSSLVTYSWKKYFWYLDYYLHLKLWHLLLRNHEKFDRASASLDIFTFYVSIELYPCSLVIVIVLCYFKFSWNTLEMSKQVRIVVTLKMKVLYFQEVCNHLTKKELLQWIHL